MKKYLFVLAFIPTLAFARNPGEANPVGVTMFPSSAIWNMSVEYAEVHSSNALWMDSVNGHTLHDFHVEFASAAYTGGMNGLPINFVHWTDLPHSTVTVGIYAYESDTQPVGGMPMPSDLLTECMPWPGDPPAPDVDCSDRHLLIVDVDSHTLYEMHAATKIAGNWQVSQFSMWDLNSNAMRTDGWTSADAAGLPIAPLLLRYSEIQQAGPGGTIPHALRFTISLVHSPSLWPASHYANSGGVLNPPLGMRVRMKSSYSCVNLSTTTQVICNTLKKYGMFLADTGGDWFVQGTPDRGWDDLQIHNEFLTIIPRDAFEVLEQNTWRITPNSYAGRSPVVPPTLMKGNVEIH